MADQKVKTHYERAKEKKEEKKPEQKVRVYYSPTTGKKQGPYKQADERENRHLKRQQENREARERQQKPRQQTAAQIARGAVGGWLNRGINNFLDNMNQPVIGREPEPPRHERKEGRGKERREREEHRPATPFDIPQGPFMDLGALDGGGGIDLDLHPDPMYRGLGRPRPGRHGDGRVHKVTTTTRVYKD